jgi:Rrf2 family protein
MLYSKYCEYSIIALAYLYSKKDVDKYIMVREISEKTKIPHYFLSKIFQDLANTEWVISKKGRNGGFVIAVDGKKLRLMDIIEWSDGIQGFNDCIIGGNDECGRDLRCTMHHKCSDLRNRITSFFETMTIYDVTEMRNE